MFNTDMQKKKWYIKAKKSVSTDILSKYKHEKDFSSNHPDTRNWIKIPWKSSGGIMQS